MANSCADVKAPMPLSFFTGIVSLLLALVTIPGNLIVCIAVLKDPFRSLKTPFTFFVVNLAVADLVVGAVIEPLSALTHFREGFSLEIRLKPCCSDGGSLRSHQLSFAVSCEVQHKSSDCHSGVNLVGFSLAVVHLLQGRCFKVRLCVCQHDCGSHFAHFSLHLRSSFCFATEFAIRGQSSKNQGGVGGEEHYTGIYGDVGLLPLLLYSIVHNNLHHESLFIL